jgi:hypothetical protein
MPPRNASANLVRWLGVHSIIASLELLGSDGIADGRLGRALAELRKVGPAEALGLLSDEGERDVGGDGRLLESGLEDVLPGGQVRQRDVNELIQSAWAQESLIQELRPVRGADEEHVLLDSHAIDLGQQLVHDTVASTTCVALR